MDILLCYANFNTILKQSQIILNYCYKPSYNELTLINYKGEFIITSFFVNKKTILLKK